MNKFTLLSTLIVLICITDSQQACSICGVYINQTLCNAVNTTCQWSSGSCQPIANTTSCSNQTTMQCAFSITLGQCVANTNTSTAKTQPCIDVPNPTASCTSQTTNCPAYSTSTQYCYLSGSNCTLNTLFNCTTTSTTTSTSSSKTGSSAPILSFLAILVALMMMI